MSKECWVCLSAPIGATAGVHTDCAGSQSSAPLGPPGQAVVEVSLGHGGVPGVDYAGQNLEGYLKP